MNGNLIEWHPLFFFQVVYKCSISDSSTDYVVENTKKHKSISYRSIIVHAKCVCVCVCVYFVSGFFCLSLLLDKVSFRFALSLQVTMQRACRAL